MFFAKLWAPEMGETGFRRELAGTQTMTITMTTTLIYPILHDPQTSCLEI